MYSKIKVLYTIVKFCVKYANNRSSDIFSVHVGVIKCEALSPLLFSLYLNDLEIIALQITVNHYILKCYFCIC